MRGIRIGRGRGRRDERKRERKRKERQTYRHQNIVNALINDLFEKSNSQGI